MKFTREDAQELNESIRNMNSPNLEEGLLSDVAIHAKDKVVGFAKKVATRVGGSTSRAGDAVKKLVAKGKDKVASAADSVGVLGQKVKEKLADNSEFVRAAVAKGAMRRAIKPEKDIIGGPRTAEMRKKVEGAILARHKDELLGNKPKPAAKKRVRTKNESPAEIRARVEARAAAKTKPTKKPTEAERAHANEVEASERNPAPTKETKKKAKKKAEKKPKTPPTDESLIGTARDPILPPPRSISLAELDAASPPNKKAKKKVLTVESLIRKYYK